MIGARSQVQRSCDELGICQHRKPRCAGCTAEPLRLAPGVLDAYRVGFWGTPAQRRELGRFAKIAAWWIVVCGLAGLAAGLVSGALK